MGVDWVPARPRAGADLGEVAGLIDGQARFVRRLMFGAGDPGPAPGDGLLDRLDVPVVDGYWPSFRVGAVVRDPVLPPEWRSAACSTMLPADARRAVARWRWWHGEAGAGRMRHYLARLSAHETAQEVAAAQGVLLELVQQAKTRTNAWTRRDRFEQACARALALPAAPLPPPPGPPPASGADDAPVAGQASWTQAGAAHLALLREAVREFNRAVPAGFKTHAPRPAPADDRRVEQFFAWVTSWLDEGYGLYVWC
ncbi:hypothetical protein ABZS66_59215 [Dactylosporangium sp. NPDC005572]|uniref:hypothetical protein n=1 Tax=Dactylosporangium sp. NPDC005572 TaxID=3156889 RepID=UPI0033A8B151